MNKAANKSKPRPYDIVSHIKTAPFLTPQMLATQWGIQPSHAKDLLQRHYHYAAEQMTKAPAKHHKCKPIPKRQFPTPNQKEPTK